MQSGVGEEWIREASAEFLAGSSQQLAGCESAIKSIGHKFIQTTRMTKKYIFELQNNYHEMSNLIQPIKTNFFFQKNW